MILPPKNHLTDQDLYQFLDAEVDLGSRQTVRAHLDTCSACQTRLEEIESLFARIENLPEEPLGRDLSIEVVQALQLPATRMPAFRWVLGFEVLIAIAVLISLLPVFSQWIRRIPLETIQAYASEFVSDMQGMVFIETSGWINALISSVIQTTSVFLMSLEIPIPAIQVWLGLASAAVAWFVLNGLLLGPLGKPKEL